MRLDLCYSFQFSHLYKIDTLWSFRLSEWHKTWVATPRSLSVLEGFWLCFLFSAVSLSQWKTDPSLSRVLMLEDKGDSNAIQKNRNKKCFFFTWFKEKRYSKCEEITEVKQIIYDDDMLIDIFIYSVIEVPIEFNIRSGSVAYGRTLTDITDLRFPICCEFFGGNWSSGISSIVLKHWRSVVIN